MRRLLFIAMLAVFAVQTSCQITPPTYSTPVSVAKKNLDASIKVNIADQKRKQSKALPPVVKDALMPEAGDSTTAHNTLYNKRFNIHVNNIDAQLFFQNMRKNTPYNIIVAPTISGTMSLDLQNVTIPEIFQAAHDLYGYEFNRTNYAFEVFQPAMQTHLFRVNYLDVKRDATSKTSLASSDLVDAGSTTSSINATSSDSGQTTTRTLQETNSVQTSSSIDFWNSLSDSLKTLIGTDGGHMITVNPASGVVMVKAYPNELRQVGIFLDRMQSSMNRQVVLEVSLIEVALSDAFQAGIDWNALGFATATAATGSLVNPFTTFTVEAAPYSAVLKMLEQQGTVQVLSNPRVLTVNNQQSVIKVGAENYYVTGVTSIPTTNSNGDATSSTSVNLTPFFSGITLNITPQIDYNSQVLLHVHPTVSVVKQEEKTIDLGTSGGQMTLPLASESLREYDSIIRAANNQMIIIGGMITNTLSENVSQTPGLGKIPFFGALFRSNSQVAQKMEMVIVLKPVMITEHPQQIINDLKSTESRMEVLDRGFHQGTMVDMLGNEAEIS